MPSRYRSSSPIWRRSRDRIDGPEDLRAQHIDGFEAWLEAERPVADPPVHRAREGRRDAAPDRSRARRPDLGRVSGNGCAISAPSPSSALARAMLIVLSSRVSFATPRAPMSNSSFAGLASRSPIEGDAALHRATAAVEAVISEHGRIGHEHPAFKSLYFIRMRRSLPISTLIDDLHGAPSSAGPRSAAASRAAVARDRASSWSAARP